MDSEHMQYPIKRVIHSTAECRYNYVISGQYTSTKRFEARLQR